MQRQRRYPNQLDYPMLMLARAHLHELDCMIEQMRLVELARNTHPSHRPSFVPALIAWLRERLPARLAQGTRPARAGELSS